MIPLLYGIGVVFFPSLFNHSMPAMLIRSSKSTQTITWIVYDPNSGRPTYFSFFNSLFINPHSLSQENRRKIFAHEKIHIQQCHSLDLCIAEIICIANWFNPFVWLIKQLILENHEYIADQQVIRK